MSTDPDPRAILQWLLSKGWFTTAMTLEEESGVSVTNYPGKLAFVRDLCYNGTFDKLQSLIQELLPDDRERQVMIATQDLRETLSQVDSQEDMSRFLGKLTSCRGLLPDRTYDDFLSAASAGGASTHRVFHDWSKASGRYRLFESLLVKLAPLFPDPGAQMTSAKTNASPDPVLAAPAVPNNNSSAKTFRQISEYVDESSQPIRTVRFSDNGKWLAIGTNSQSLIIADPANDLARLGQRHKVHAGSIFCAAWSPDDSIIATGSNDQQIRFTSLSALLSGENVNHTNMNLKTRIGLNLGTVRCLTFVNQNQLVAGFSQDTCVRLLEAEKVVTELNCGYRGYISSLSRVDNLVSAGTSEGRACVFDSRSSEKVLDLGFLGNDAVSVDIRGTSLALGTGTTVSLWDIRSSKQAVWENSSSHSDSVRSVRFGSDFISSVSFDKSIRVFDFSSAAERQTLHRHMNRVVGLDVSLSDMMVSCGCDSRVVLWS